MNVLPNGKIMISAEDIRTANEVHLYKGHTLYIVIEDTVYGFQEGNSEWFVKENFWDYLESDLMQTYFTPIAKEDAAQLFLGWSRNPAADSMRLNEAIKFAVDHHAGQFRKSTARPYIQHPLETMLILQSINADINLQIAGVLHDTLEDTDASEEDLRSLFGDDVADLVTAHSEDKTQSWFERKSRAIEELVTADLRLKMLIMADKVSNLRSMFADYKQVGDALWNRFNAGCAQQAWYYSGIQDALWDMQNIPKCAAVYWEMVSLYKDLFVRFYYDPANEQLFQHCLDGTCFFLVKGNPEWKKTDAPLPLGLRQIERSAAEKTEDNWSAPFWSTHDHDIENAYYNLYTSSQRSLEVYITDKTLVLHCEDFGPTCRAMTGRDEYEFYYQLSETDTRRFLVRLRLQNNLTTPLGDLLKKHFGSDDGTRKFEAFCEKNQIEFCRFCI